MKTKVIGILPILLVTAGCSLSPVPECLTGTQKCEPNEIFGSGVVSVCTDSGTWQPLQSCLKCQDNSCGEQTVDASCGKDGDTKCVIWNNESLQFTCVHNNWLPTLCASACEDNRCLMSGQHCEVEGERRCTWAEHFKLAVQSVCTEHRWMSLFCETGMVCRDNVCGEPESDPVDVCPADNPECQSVDGCGVGEIKDTEENCICDADNHWIGTTGHCVCDEGYVKIGGNCEVKVNCESNEIWEESSNTCLCDGSKHWAGSAGNCDCEENYVKIEGNCEQKAVCASSEIWEESTNTCLCDSSKHWTGSAGSCDCEENYVRIADNCEEKAVCASNEVWEKTTNKCQCDSSKHWTGSAGNCSCEASALKIGDQCIIAGETIKFGSYHQSADTSQIDELEWQVLKTESDRILVVSKYILEAREYYKSYVSISWEKSTMRSWLNGLGKSSNSAGTDYTNDGFIKTAFSDSERAKIIKITNTDNGNDYNSVNGNATEDSIFLLSVNEARTYFSDDSKRRSLGTPYAVDRTGLSVNKTNDCLSWGCYGGWWLRSPGVYDTRAVYVGSSGNIDSSGWDVSSKNWGVRPAMWLKVE